MALFYITGTSGSGKSSVRDKLEQLGYEAYDTDTSINEWLDRRTGQIDSFAPENSFSPDEQTRWVLEHDFLMSKPKIELLVAKAKNKDVFICGHASNDINFIEYFQRVFCLLLSEQETKIRLSSRSNNTWGNDPKQLAHLMNWYKPTIERYQKLGATMIDAALPIEKVVGRIIKLTSSE